MKYWRTWMKRTNLMDAWTTGIPEQGTKEKEVPVVTKRGRASTIDADADSIRTTTIRLSEENIIYCNLMAKETKGSSMSGYINKLIEKDRLDHPAESSKAKKIYLIQKQ